MKTREKHGSKSHASLFRKPFFLQRVSLLFGGGRGHVDINFAATTAAAKETPAKQKERDQNDDYKDYQYCDHTCAAAAIIITH
jgi:hypothetical protein